MKIKTKAQSLMESTIAYAAGMAILGAAMGIWTWGNAHIPARQATYEATRMMSGIPRRQVSASGAQGGGYAVPVWPTYAVGGGLAGF
jgi:hypothetical protein